MSITVARVGIEQEEPESCLLTAGALSAELIAGNLRAIRYRGREVLRAIAYLVRDKDWATYIPKLSNLTIDQQPSGFSVRYCATCTDETGRQSLSYEAHITGSSDGCISFSAVATPDTLFLTSRCGFAVLHPLEGIAGHAARVEHVDGSLEDGVFPELIAPWQPFIAIRSITHEVSPGVSACCRMEGDVFEMEDQRNWSDASYKTYVRPLSRPWPFTMEAGVPNRQFVQLRILDRGNSEPQVTNCSEDRTIRIEIGSEDGVFPGIGLSISPEQIAPILLHASLLEALCPRLLLFHYDSAAGHGLRELLGFARIASVSDSFPCELSLEVPLPCRSDVEEELSEIAGLLAKTGLPISSVMLSLDADRRSTPPSAEWPDCPTLEQIYQAAREIFPQLRLGGGVLSFFTELNRKRPPVDLLDYVSHCTCPIVHAADDRSVMQTLESLPYITRSTRAFIGPGKRYRIGPSTIGMRTNPYGSCVMANPERTRRVMTNDDPRQQALFAAAWMIGYVASTHEGHLDTLTVGALTGPLGLTSTDSEVPVKYPVFHVAKGLAELGYQPRYACLSSDPSRILAVAGSSRDGRLVLWLANLTGERQRAALPASERMLSLTLLDEKDKNAMREASVSSSAVNGRTVVELLPYAVARALFKGAGDLSRS